MVEFALTAFLLFGLIFGIMDFSMAFYVDHHLADAARAGARYAMVRGANWGVACATVTSYSCTASSANISNYVKSLTPPGMLSSKITVETKWFGSNPTGVSCNSGQTSSTSCFFSSVSVKVQYSQYPVSFISAFRSSFPLSSVSVITIAQ